MKNKFKLVALSFGLFALVSCQNSVQENPKADTTVQTLAINCENRDSNLVPGLPATMGEAPSNPTNVAAGIQKYKELMSSDPKNAEFYAKQIELMSEKLNEFNLQFTNSCGE